MAKRSNRHINIFDSYNEDDIKKMRLALQKMPAFSCINEVDYLKYLPCSECGCDPPEEGHSLIQDASIIFLNYPLCKECDGYDINWKYVASIYAIFGINKEVEVQRIKNALWESGILK
jgi:hypothetical protein